MFWWLISDRYGNDANSYAPSMLFLLLVFIPAPSTEVVVDDDQPSCVCNGQCPVRAATSFATSGLDFPNKLCVPHL